MKKIRLIAVFMMMFAGSVHAEIEEQQQIVNTMSTIFDPLRTADAAKFDSVVAPGFYLFDGGIRFNGNSIVNFIKTQHAAGKRYEWSVTEPDVHINGDTSWIACVNRGSISDASGTTKQDWLESAYLQNRQASGRSSLHEAPVFP